MTEPIRLTSCAPEPPSGGHKPDTPSDEKARQGSALVKDLRILLIEPNSIFALAAEDMLLRNGASLVQVAASRMEALQCLEAALYDVALVDLKLGVRDDVAIAGRLRLLCIPFAFIAGYGERVVVPLPFADRMVISRPCTEEYLLSCLAQLLGSRQ